MSINPPELNQIKEANSSSARADELKLRWFLIIPALFAAFFLLLYLINFNDGFGNQGDFGTFGDFLGGTLNPVLGFVTVVLLVLSLRKQSQELAMSREELALTREELAKTKEETALSRRAMEAQVEHLKKEAKLSELNNVLTAQIDIISKLLKVDLIQIRSTITNFEQVLNCSAHTEPYIEEFRTRFNSQVNNPVQITGKELEIQLIQLAGISLAYADESNSPLYSLPYLVKASSLLGKFYQFNKSENIEGLLKILHERIRVGSKQI